MRLAKLVIILLACVCLVMALEVKEVRQDQAEMKQAYDAFLQRKAGGKTLESLIVIESLAVFKSQSGIVGCAILKGGRK